MALSKAQQAAREEALVGLREQLPRGSRVSTIDVNAGPRSGPCHFMLLAAAPISRAYSKEQGWYDAAEPHVFNVTFQAATVLGARLGRNSRGIIGEYRSNLVHDLARALYGDEKALRVDSL
jgi:hypothetical protein